MRRSSLEGIASKISQNASIVASFLRENDHREFTFDPKGPAKFPNGADEEVLEARYELIWAARQMQYLALGPVESFQMFALSGAIDTTSLRWIYHYNIPAAVPIDTGISFSDLAHKTNLSERTLTRVIRHAMTNNIFREITPGHVSHTSLSVQLALPDNPICGMIGHQTELMFPSVSKLVEAHEKYGTWDESANHTPFGVAFNTEERALDWWAKDPVSSARFAESMKFATTSGPFSTQHIVNSFDWESLGEALVVDVGGSAGHVSKVIASAAPRLRFVVQDLVAMVAKGEADLEPLFRDRIKFQAHNFFDPNPVQEPDVFFLRWVLHDWPDSDVISILRQLVRNMGPKTILLINDVVIPPKESMYPLREKYIRNMDLVMMAAFNSLERTINDWNDLITKVDPRLKVLGVKTPQGSGISMIKVMKSET